MFGSEQKSFTVIELLVVIAIIGVLASIVLVSLSGTRDRANIAKTLLYSNQIYHSLGADIVGNWTFDEGTGTTALDSSGYNRNGIINGPTYTSDTPQKAAGQGSGKYALSFDGVNDKIDISNIGDNPAVTASGWIKIPSSFAQWDVTFTYGTRRLIINSGNPGSTDIKCFSSNSLGTNFNSSSYTLSTNNWYYVLCVIDWDNKIGRFFVNGAQVGSDFTFTGSQSSGNSFNIGYEPGYGYYFHGLIDEVQIYSRALTVSEIQQHYAAGLETHPNLALK